MTAPILAELGDARRFSRVIADRAQDRTCKGATRAARSLPRAGCDEVHFHALHSTRQIEV